MLEAYIVRVSYKDDSDDVRLSVEAKNASAGGVVTKKAAGRQAIALVRSLVSLVNTLPTLPDADILVSMRLYYHDDRVPSGEDWVPRHFEDARDLAPESFSGGAPTKLLAGTTTTRFHQMAMSIALKKDYVDQAAAAAASSADTPMRGSAAPATASASSPAAAAVDLAGGGEGVSDDVNAVDGPEDDASRFKRWVQAVRRFVVHRQSASIPALRDEFGDEIPPVMLRRILEELADRNVLLRPKSKRRGAGYTVLAVDLPATAAAAAASAAVAAAPRLVTAETPGDGATVAPAALPAGADTPQRLWSLAVLLAWSARGSYLTQASIAQALGLGRKERAITRSLVAKLAERGLIASAPKGSLGREVYDCVGLKRATSESSAWLERSGHAEYARGLGLHLLSDDVPTPSSRRGSDASSVSSTRLTKRPRDGQHQDSPMSTSPNHIEKEEGNDGEDDDDDQSAHPRRVSGRLLSKRLARSSKRPQRAEWV